MNLSLRDRLREGLSLPADIHDDAIVMRVLGAEALRQALVDALPFTDAQESDDRLIAKVRGLVNGTKPVRPEQSAALTPREREVLDLLLGGLTTLGAAKALGITIKTAETHRANMYRKLGVHSVPELFRLAALRGWLPDTDGDE